MWIPAEGQGEMGQDGSAQAGKQEEKGVNSLLTFFFYSGPEWTGGCLPTLGRTIHFNKCTRSNGNSSGSVLPDTSRNMISSGYLMAQLNWHMTLMIPVIIIVLNTISTNNAGRISLIALTLLFRCQDLWEDIIQSALLKCRVIFQLVSQSPDFIILFLFCLLFIVFYICG